MKHWYVVHAKPRQEAVAEEHLRRQGFTTYLPKVRVRKLKRDRWIKVVEPLFPRYLFIQVDAQQSSLAPVRSTLGVAGLVRFGALLQPLPNSVIDFLLQAEDPGSRQHHADEWPHKPGDAVHVLAGPFAGLPGIFQALSGEERALLLIELLGRQSTVTVPIATITKATD